MISKRGFTLVELLVVIFIISIVTSVALLTINNNENKRLETIANEIIQLITLAEEEAMLQPTILGLNVKSQKLEFTTLTPGTKKIPHWSLFKSHVFKLPNLPDDIHFTVSIPNEKPIINKTLLAHQPQIIFSTNGDLTPFTIYISKTGGKPRYAVQGNANGTVTKLSLT